MTATAMARQDADVGAGRVEVEIPMALPSVANLRLHWAKKARMVKAQRVATSLSLRAKVHAVNAVRWEAFVMSAPANVSSLAITLTRVSPRALDDDNLASAFKAVRDEVAAYFGVDDRDPCIEWRYAQSKGKAAVRISFEIQGEMRAR